MRIMHVSITAGNVDIQTASQKPISPLEEKSERHQEKQFVRRQNSEK